MGETIVPTRNIVPSVASRSGTRPLTMSRPLKTPIPAPARRPTTTASAEETGMQRSNFQALMAKYDIRIRGIDADKDDQ